jgi:hypothetical protein
MGDPFYCSRWPRCRVSVAQRPSIAHRKDHHEGPLIGHTGLWWFAEKAVGAACWNVCLQLFRIVTFDTNQNYNLLKSRWVERVNNFNKVQSGGLILVSHSFDDLVSYFGANLSLSVVIAPDRYDIPGDPSFSYALGKYRLAQYLPCCEVQ